MNSYWSRVSPPNLSLFLPSPCPMAAAVALMHGAGPPFPQGPCMAGGPGPHGGGGGGPLGAGSPPCGPLGGRPLRRKLLDSNPVPKLAHFCAANMENQMEVAVYVLGSFFNAELVSYQFVVVLFLVSCMYMYTCMEYLGYLSRHRCNMSSIC